MSSVNFQIAVNDLLTNEMLRVFGVIADAYSVPFDEMVSACGWDALRGRYVGRLAPKEIVVQEVVVEKPEVVQEVAKVKRQYNRKPKEPVVVADVLEKVLEKKEPENNPVPPVDKPKRQYNRKPKADAVAEQPLVEKPATDVPKQRTTIDRGLTINRLKHKMVLQMTRKDTAKQSLVLDVVFNEQSKTFFNRSTRFEYKTLQEANRLWCYEQRVTASKNVWTDFKLFDMVNNVLKSINTLHEDDWISGLTAPQLNCFVDLDFLFPGETAQEKRVTAVLENKESSAVTQRGRPRNEVGKYEFVTDDNADN